MSHGTRKKLLIVSRSHEPRGGADRIVADLCRSLPERGWEVRLGLCVGQRFNRIEPYRELYPDLPILPLDGTLGTRDARVSAIVEAIDAERPDVVLSMRVFDAIAAVESVNESRRPRLAYGVRACEAAYLEDVRRFSANLDLCVTSGELIAALCRDYAGLPAARVVSIGGGVRLPQQEVVVRNPGKTIRLLYAGRLEQPQKRVLDLVPLVAELHRRKVAFQLDVVGAGPAEDDLAAGLASETASGTVTFHGWQSRDELYRRFLPEADVFVHLAGWEGMTIAPREAMAHGAVPVISEFPGLRAEGLYVDGETALTFPVGDVERAAEAIERLHRETGLLARLSSAAAASQVGRYSFEGSMDAWVEAFDRVVALPKRSGPMPEVPDSTCGRLSALGLPAAWESRLRRLLGKPVQHGDPGSEWPTASGLLDDEQRRRIAELSAALDREPGAAVEGAKQDAPAAAGLGQG